MGWIDPAGKCKHCGIHISYHSDDTVFLHDIKTWGEDWPSKRYNNGYYCTEERKTSAEPEDSK